MNSRTLQCSLVAVISALHSCANSLLWACSILTGAIRGFRFNESLLLRTQKCRRKWRTDFVTALHFDSILTPLRPPRKHQKIICAAW